MTQITPAEAKRLHAEHRPKPSSLQAQEAEEMWLAEIKKGAEEGDDSAHMPYSNAEWSRASRFVKDATARRIEKLGFHVAHIGNGNFFVRFSPSFGERIGERLIGTTKRALATTAVIYIAYAVIFILGLWPLW